MIETVSAAVVIGMAIAMFPLIPVLLGLYIVKVLRTL